MGAIPSELAHNSWLQEIQGSAKPSRIVCQLNNMAVQQNLG